MFNRFFCLALVFFSSLCFSKEPNFKSAWQIAIENPAEYEEILRSSPVASAESAQIASLSWDESAYAGFSISEWNRAYSTPVFNNQGLKGDALKPMKSIYYYVYPTYPFGNYSPEIIMYIFSQSGKFLGRLLSLSGNGTENVSALNLPSNSKMYIGIRIWGGGGSLSNAPFIGNTRVTVTY